MTRHHRVGFLANVTFAFLAVASSATPAWAVTDVPSVPGWLGISISDVGEDLAERLATTFGPGAAIGVVVVDVLKGGPAERAPLKRGDVIVQVDAQPIWDVRQLQRTIRAQSIDQRVMVTVLRDASRVTLAVTIGRMPIEARAQLAGERFGFLVRGADDQEPRRTPTEPTGRIFVAFVDADSPAARAGMRPQDVILKANDQLIGTMEDFERAMRSAGRAVSLQIERRGTPQPLTLNVALPSR